MKVRINSNDRVMIRNELGATMVFIKKKIIVFFDGHIVITNWLRKKSRKNKW